MPGVFAAGGIAVALIIVGLLAVAAPENAAPSTIQTRGGTAPPGAARQTAVTGLPTGPSYATSTATAPSSPTPVPATATLEPTSTSVPPTPTPFAMIVYKTGGDGVYVRKSPASSEKIQAWPDNTTMLIVGQTVETGTGKWSNVRDPAGNVGWVPQEYLAFPTPTPAPTPTLDRSRYRLELIASRGYKEYGYAKVEGRVKNISSASLRVDVVIEWYTADMEFVKKDSALIDYDPILPGQTSPFDSITTDNPLMKRYTVTFKEFLGGTIPTLDSRKR